MVACQMRLVVGKGQRCWPTTANLLQLGNGVCCGSVMKPLKYQRGDIMPTGVSVFSHYKPFENLPFPVPFPVTSRVRVFT